MERAEGWVSYQWFSLASFAAKLFIFLCGFAPLAARLLASVMGNHNAGQTQEVRRDGLLRTIENVENFLAGKPTNVVNP